MRGRILGRFSIRAAVVLGLAFGLAACAGEEPLPRCGAGALEPLVVRAGALFDGTGGPVVRDAVIVVVRDRIAAAGPAAEVVLPPCGRIFDLPDATVLPGVIDNHVHLRLALEAGRDVLGPWLRAGVTTLVDNGTERGGVERLREMAARISKAAPRLLVAGPIFTAPGGYPDAGGTPAVPGSMAGETPVVPGDMAGETPAVPGGTGEARGVPGEEALPGPPASRRPSPLDPSRVAEPVASAAEARQKVLRLLDEERADLVKAAIERGFLEDVDDAGWPVPAPEALAALAAAAHARGRTARAHVTQPGELAMALDAGFDAAAHTPIGEIPDDLLERAARQGFVLVSTAALWEQDGAELAAAARSNLARYVRMGGRVALGTDAPFQPSGGMPMPELRALIAAGLTPREALLAATRDGAVAVGRGRDLGTIEPGKLADLIAVPGDPLADVEAMARVTLVIRGGEVVVAPAEE